MAILASFLIFLCASLELVSGEHEHTFGVYLGAPFFRASRVTKLDVTRFGAVGDGKTDDSEALKLAWSAACQKSTGVATITVPSGKTFFISPTEFGGPCKTHNITFEILGSIVAPPKSAWKNIGGSWLKFLRVDGRLAIVGNGEGLIDGQGESWWTNEKSGRPVAMVFSHYNNLVISGLKHINSPKFHMSISESNNVNITKLYMIAPDESPNTDGIDILYSTNIRIQNCTIETGDDCIAIKGGTSNLTISDIKCGPGHGISVGSLGQSGKHDQVEGISISNCTFNRTQNGIRIKTWQGGSGFAKNINFSYINFTESGNPLIIDQFYCPHSICSNRESAVKVSDVRYDHIYGSSSNNNTIVLRCSDAAPCTNIVLDDVNITSAEPTASAVCNNAFGTAEYTSPPVKCLTQNTH